MAPAWLRCALISISLLAACAQPEPSVQAPTPSEPALVASKIPVDASPGLSLATPSDRGLILLMEERAALMPSIGVAPLAETPREAGEYELRIWYRRPERRFFLRFWNEGEAVHGAAWVWWTAGGDAHYVHAEIDDWVDCPIAIPAGQVEGCRVHFPANQRWADALARFEASAVWTLPDMSEVGLGFDADEEFHELLLVELRDGARTRNYYYRDFEDLGDPPPEIEAVLALRQAMWDALSEAEWAYDVSGEPVKTRHPAPGS
jgi:hypothetical protein